VRPWYETAFDEDYLARYPHRDDEEATRDVTAIVDLLDPPRDGPLLDLACGAGRHLLALSRAGFRRLAGLDLSGELLEVARRRLDAAGFSDVKLVRADMRSIPYADRFAAALSIFTSFGYFEADDENAVVLRAVHRALRPDGRFLIDTLSRSVTLAELAGEEERECDGRTLRIRRRVSADGLRVEKETRVVADSGEEEVYRESVRMYTADELSTMFEQAGFLDVSAFGSLRGEPHREASPRLVVVGRKGGG